MVPEIKQDTGYDNVELWLLDLADFGSVKSFARRFEEQEKRLDILVENAGMLPGFKAETTVDGWESTSVLVQISRLKTITDLDRMSQFTGQQSIHFPSCPAPSASYDRNGKNTQHNTQAGDSCKRGALLD